MRQMRGAGTRYDLMQRDDNLESCKRDIRRQGHRNVVKSTAIDLHFKLCLLQSRTYSHCLLQGAEKKKKKRAVSIPASVRKNVCGLPSLCAAWILYITLRARENKPKPNAACRSRNRSSNQISGMMVNRTMLGAARSPQSLLRGPSVSTAPVSFTAAQRLAAMASSPISTQEELSHPRLETERWESFEHVDRRKRWRREERGEGQGARAGGQ